MSLESEKTIEYPGVPPEIGEIFNEIKTTNEANAEILMKGELGIPIESSIIQLPNVYNSILGFNLTLYHLLHFSLMHQPSERNPFVGGTPYLCIQGQKEDNRYTTLVESDGPEEVFALSHIFHIPDNFSISDLLPSDTEIEQLQDRDTIDNKAPPKIILLGSLLAAIQSPLSQQLNAALLRGKYTEENGTSSYDDFGYSSSLGIDESLSMEVPQGSVKITFPDANDPSSLNILLLYTKTDTITGVPVPQYHLIKRSKESDELNKIPKCRISIHNPTKAFVQSCQDTASTCLLMFDPRYHGEVSTFVKALSQIRQYKVHRKSANKNYSLEIITPGTGKTYLNGLWCKTRPKNGSVDLNFVSRNPARAFTIDPLNFFSGYSESDLELATLQVTANRDSQAQNPSGLRDIRKFVSTTLPDIQIEDTTLYQVVKSDASVHPTAIDTGGVDWEQCEARPTSFSGKTRELQTMVENPWLALYELGQNALNGEGEALNPAFIITYDDGERVVFNGNNIDTTRQVSEIIVYNGGDGYISPTRATGHAGDEQGSGHHRRGLKHVGLLMAKYGLATLEIQSWYPQEEKAISWVGRYELTTHSDDPTPMLQLRHTVFQEGNGSRQNIIRLIQPDQIIVNALAQLPKLYLQANPGYGGLVPCARPYRPLAEVDINDVTASILAPESLGIPVSPVYQSLFVDSLASLIEYGNATLLLWSISGGLNATTGRAIYRGTDSTAKNTTLLPELFHQMVKEGKVGQEVWEKIFESLLEVKLFADISEPTTDSPQSIPLELQYAGWVSYTKDTLPPKAKNPILGAWEAFVARHPDVKGIVQGSSDLSHLTSRKALGGASERILVLKVHYLFDMLTSAGIAGGYALADKLVAEVAKKKGPLRDFERVCLREVKREEERDFDTVIQKFLECRDIFDLTQTESTLELTVSEEHLHINPENAKSILPTNASFRDALIFLIFEFEKRGFQTELLLLDSENQSVTTLLLSCELEKDGSTIKLIANGTTDFASTTDLSASTPFKIKIESKSCEEAYAQKVYKKVRNLYKSNSSQETPDLDEVEILENKVRALEEILSGASLGQQFVFKAYTLLEQFRAIADEAGFVSRKYRTTITNLGVTIVFLLVLSAGYFTYEEEVNDAIQPVWDEVKPIVDKYSPVRPSGNQPFGGPAIKGGMTSFGQVNFGNEDGADLSGINTIEQIANQSNDVHILVEPGMPGIDYSGVYIGTVINSISINSIAKTAYGTNSYQEVPEESYRYNSIPKGRPDNPLSKIEYKAQVLPTNGWGTIHLRPGERPIAFNGIERLELRQNQMTGSWEVRSDEPLSDFIIYTGPANPRDLEYLSAKPNDEDLKPLTTIELLDDDLATQVNNVLTDPMFNSSSQRINEVLRIWRDRSESGAGCPADELNWDSLYEYTASALNCRVNPCNGYSYAVVSLLRLVDIPARVVTGYFVGQREITQSESHAIVMAYLKEAGIWIYIEPQDGRISEEYLAAQAEGVSSPVSADALIGTLDDSLLSQDTQHTGMESVPLGLNNPQGTTSLIPATTSSGSNPSQSYLSNQGSESEFGFNPPSSQIVSTDRPGKYLLYTANLGLPIFSTGVGIAIDRRREAGKGKKRNTHKPKKRRR